MQQINELVNAVRKINFKKSYANFIPNSCRCNTAMHNICKRIITYLCPSVYCLKDIVTDIRFDIQTLLQFKPATTTTTCYLSIRCV